MLASIKGFDSNLTSVVVRLFPTTASRPSKQATMSPIRPHVLRQNLVFLLTQAWGHTQQRRHASLSGHQNYPLPLFRSGSEAGGFGWALNDDDAQEVPSQASGKAAQGLPSQGSGK